MFFASQNAVKGQDALNVPQFAKCKLDSLKHRKGMVKWGKDDGKWLANSSYDGIVEDSGYVYIAGFGKEWNYEYSKIILRKGLDSLPSRINKYVRKHFKKPEKVYYAEENTDNKGNVKEITVRVNGPRDNGNYYEIVFDSLGNFMKYPIMRRVPVIDF